jgi:hypothetical protein
MKVRCASVTSSKGGITVGKIYDVLSISFGSQGVKVRIFSDETATPALFTMDNFVLVDGCIPKNWIAYTYTERGFSFVLGPSPWFESDFWSRYFDNEEQSIRIFKEEIMKAGIGPPRVPIVPGSYFAKDVINEEELFALSKIFLDANTSELPIIEYLGNSQVLERKITSTGYLSVIQFDRDLPKNDEKNKWYWNFKHPLLDHGGSFIAWYASSNIIKLEAIAHNDLWPAYFNAKDFSHA